MSTLTTTVRHSAPAQWIVAAIGAIVVAAVAVTLVLVLSDSSSSSSTPSTSLSGTTSCATIPGTHVTFC